MCAKYYFFSRHTFITVLIGILICESTSNERPVQCRDDLDHAVENFRQVRAKTSKQLLIVGAVRHDSTFGRQVVSGNHACCYPCLFQGVHQVCEGFAAPMMARSFFSFLSR